MSSWEPALALKPTVQAANGDAGWPENEEPDFGRSGSLADSLRSGSADQQEAHVEIQNLAERYKDRSR